MLQRAATHCNTLASRPNEGRVVTQVSTHSHTHTHCNTLQHTTAHYNTLYLSDHQGDSLRGYGVATVSRIYKFIGLFCRILSLFWSSFAKETYNFVDPTNQSHPIVATQVSVHTHTHTHIHTHRNTLQHTATHCNTLQHTATHTATHCNTVTSRPNEGLFDTKVSTHTLQHTATH